MEGWHSHDRAYPPGRQTQTKRNSGAARTLTLSLQAGAGALNPNFQFTSVCCSSPECRLWVNLRPSQRVPATSGVGGRPDLLWARPEGPGVAISGHSDLVPNKRGIPHPSVRPFHPIAHPEPAGRLVAPPENGAVETCRGAECRDRPLHQCIRNPARSSSISR